MDCKSLEHYATSYIANDRVLGSNNIRSYPNNTIIAFSSNGLELTEDMARRSLDIRLECYDEDIKRRVFKINDLNIYCFQNRELLLNSLYSLISNWYKQGMPMGESLASFQQWSQITGGILTSNGYVNPFNKRSIITDSMRLTGDTAALDLSKLYKLMYNDYGNKELKAKEIIDLAREYGIFANIVESKSSRKMTTLLRKYNNRIIGGLKLLINNDYKEARYYIVKIDN